MANIRVAGIVLLSTLLFGAVAARQAAPEQLVVKVDKTRLIPRLIHQTYRTSELPPKLEEYAASWKAMNPGYTYKLYNDAEARDFVKEELPEYLPAYDALPQPVEKADFFRYLVVYKFGGIYADVDTNCVVPLDDYISHDSRMVVGLERHFKSLEEAHANDYVRQFQILQWTFMAAPGHPVLKELCDSIASHALEKEAILADANAANAVVLERTGPGAFTDAVLKYFEMDAPSKQPVPAAMIPGEKRSYWVEILPEVAFGTLHEEQWSNAGVKVIHHFYGSWKRHTPQRRELGELDAKVPGDGFDYHLSYNGSTSFVVSPRATTGVMPPHFQIPHAFGMMDNFQMPAGYALQCEYVEVNRTCDGDMASLVDPPPEHPKECAFAMKDVIMGWHLDMGYSKHMPLYNPCMQEGFECKIVDWFVTCPEVSPKEDAEEHDPSKLYGDRAFLVESSVSFALLDIEYFKHEEFEKAFRETYIKQVAEAANVTESHVSIRKISPGSVVVSSRVMFFPQGYGDPMVRSEKFLEILKLSPRLVFYEFDGYGEVTTEHAESYTADSDFSLTASPTAAPTDAPTMAPTAAPTGAPTTAAPTEAPTDAPTAAPTAPTEAPTEAPEAESPASEDTAASGAADADTDTDDDESFFSEHSVLLIAIGIGVGVILGGVGAGLAFAYIQRQGGTPESEALVPSKGGYGTSLAPSRQARADAAAKKQAV